MITVQDLQTKKPEEMTDNLVFAVSALIKTARLALENDNAKMSPNSPDACAVSVTLSIAETLADVLGEGCEILEREVSRGLLKRTAN
ncbi:hypothetical protein [Maritalea sp.]|uniref:hypothetical protein n=1 Tax=Maritalea sp. TaxID=2003361 RepID=UPI003EF61698